VGLDVLYFSVLTVGDFSSVVKARWIARSRCLRVLRAVAVEHLPAVSSHSHLLDVIISLLLRAFFAYNS
jgi:hypothetical protein